MESSPSAVVQHTMDTVFAPWVRDLDLVLVEARPGVVVLDLPVAPKFVHGGGVMSGQTLMSAADSAMVLAASAHYGRFRPITTVQLQTSFLRPVAPAAGVARVTATVLRAGKNLVFGEIHIRAGTAPDAPLAAHATTTCALV